MPPVSEPVSEPRPSIQTFPEAPAPSPSIPDVASVQRALDDVPPPVPTAQAGGGTQDLDELAQRLYPKIRPYLKRELWLDRERAGSLTGLS
jgi:hypothetical protein